MLMPLYGKPRPRKEEAANIDPLDEELFCEDGPAPGEVHSPPTNRTFVYEVFSSVRI